jgi:hypothetical protein
MNETTKHNSLRLALEKSGCHELPKQYKAAIDTRGYWINALCLVQKRNLDEIYILAERGADGYIRYTYDTGGAMGRMSPISKLISIHPYLFLDENRMDEYLGKSDEWKRAFISQKLDTDTEGMSSEELKTALIDAIIARQRESTEEDVLSNRREEGAPSFEAYTIPESTETASIGDIVDEEEIKACVIRTEYNDFEKIEEVVSQPVRRGRPKKQR